MTQGQQSSGSWWKRAAVAALAVSVAIVEVPSQGVAAAGTLANTSAPTILPSAQMWNQFRARPGTWSEAPTSVTYQWEWCEAASDTCSPLGQPTTSDLLTVGDGQTNQRLRLTATATAPSGTATSTTPISSPVVKPAVPAAGNLDGTMTAPTILGTPAVGSQVVAVSPVWNPAPTALAYRWQRCAPDGAACADIPSATSASYLVDAGDTGSTLRVIVAANARGVLGESSPSAPTVVVAAPGTPLAPVTVSTRIGGAPRVGGTLSPITTPAAVAGSAQIVWLRCDITGSACNTISGAVAPTYSPTTADQGSTIAALGVVTSGGGTLAWFAQATAPVTEAGTPSPLSSPVLANQDPTGGPAQVTIGQTLKVGDVAWAGGPLSGRSFSWLRCGPDGDACQQILGAAGSTYTPTTTDDGFLIRALVGAANGAGSGVAVSNASGVVRGFGTVVPSPTATPPAPTIAGTTTYIPTGSAGAPATLTRTGASWLQPDAGQSFFVWLRCGRTAADCQLVRDAAGALVRSATLPIQASDIGSRFIAREYRVSMTVGGPVGDPAQDPLAGIATDPTATAFPPLLGTTVLDSAMTLPIAPPTVVATADLAATNIPAGVPTPPATITVTGAAVALQVLSAPYTGWSAGTTLTYQWHRCSGDECTPITNATARSYRLGYADIGQTMRVFITGTNAAGTVTAMSTATAEVQNPPAPANTVAPTMTGTTNVGSTLSAVRGTWTNSPASYAYQWQRCDAAGANCADIAAATTSRYKLTTTEFGMTVRVVVSATNPGGTGSATSAQSAVITNPPPPANTVAPTVTLPTGATGPVVGGVLGRTVGTWVPAATSYTYQWQRCDAAGANCADIAAATGTGYRLVVADIGATVRIGVIATNAGGSSAVAYSAVTAVVAPPPAPTNTVAPSISGTTSVYSTLTAARGTWVPTPTSYAYQWLRCDGAGANCVPITTATSTTYRLTLADYQQTIALRITATNAGGSTAAQSAVTSFVGPPPVPANTVLPVISGTPQVAVRLSTTVGTWANVPSSYAYQWQRCDAAGVNCTDIAGATARTYTPVVADTDATLRFVVTATNLGGTTSATSTQTAVVIPSLKPQPSAAPTISGPNRIGGLLSLSEGTWVGMPTSYARRWQKCNADGTGCVTISGATASSYLIPATAEGYRIRAYVVATNAAGYTVAYTALTEVIVAGSPPVVAGPPTLNGTAVYGETLTAGDGTWSGSPAPSSYSYQWQSCGADGATCVDLPSETLPTLLLGANVIGSQVRVVVRATNQFGTSEANASALSGAVAAPLPPMPVVNPVLSGTATVGEQMMVAQGTWDPVATSLEYHWMSCAEDGTGCAPIGGASGSAHVLGWAEVGRVVKVEVVGANVGGSTSVTTLASAVVKAAAPTVETPPMISGALIPGTMASVSQGTWGGAPTQFSYLWFACPASGGQADLSDCDALSTGDFSNLFLGNVGSRAWLTQSLIGKRMRVRVTAKNSSGTRIVVTTPSAPVGAAEPFSSAEPPTIFGTPAVGQQLRLDLGAYAGSLDTYDVDWIGCTSEDICETLRSGEGVVPDSIAGGDLSSSAQLQLLYGVGAVVSPNRLALSDAMLGLRVHVEVTLHPVIGENLVQISAPTTVVVPAPTPFVQVPRISGAVVPGGRVSVDFGVLNSSGALVTVGLCQPDTLGNIYQSNIYPPACGSAGSGTRWLDLFELMMRDQQPLTSETRSCSVPPCDLGTLTLTIPETTILRSVPAYGWGSDPVPDSRYVQVAAEGLKLVVTVYSLDGFTSPYHISTDVLRSGGLSELVVSGGARVGETLTIEGTLGALDSYAWRACEPVGGECVSLPNATTAQLLLPPGTKGKYVEAIVTDSTATPKLQRVIRTLSVVADPPVPSSVSLPAVLGEPVVGSDLEASPGEWSTSSFMDTTWLVCNQDGADCAEIGDAGGSRFKLTIEQVGRTVRARVHAFNLSGMAVATSDPTPVVTVPEPPVASVGPTIPLSVYAGSSISAVYGGWSKPVPEFTTLWQSCSSDGLVCTDIAGGDAQSLVITQDLAGARLRAKVIARNAGGSSVAYSNLSNLVEQPTGPPANVTAPMITDPSSWYGVFSVPAGKELRAQNGTWTNNPTAFQQDWYACTSTACVIVGSGPSIRVPDSSVGKQLELRVSAKNLFGESSYVASSRTPTVFAPPSPASTPETLVVTNLSRVITNAGSPASLGEVLRVDRPGGSSFAAFTTTYQWFTCVGAATACQPIPGATRRTYEVGMEASGMMVKAVAFVSNMSGSAQWVSALMPIGVFEIADDGDPRPIFDVGAPTPTLWPSATGYVGSPIVSSALPILETVNAFLASIRGAATPTDNYALTDQLGLAAELEYEVCDTNAVCAVSKREVLNLDLYNTTAGGFLGSGGSPSAFTPDMAEIGKDVRVRLRASWSTGRTRWVVSAPVRVTAGPVPAGYSPYSLDAQVLLSPSQLPVVGTSIAIASGGFVSALPGVLWWQRPREERIWQRCSQPASDCTTITSQTRYADAYTLTDADVGKYVRVGIRPVDPRFDTPIEWGPAVQVDPRHLSVPVGIASFYGAPLNVGSTLSPSGVEWSPAATSVRYEWRTCAYEVLCKSAPVVGTQTSLSLTNAYIGNRVEVRIYASNADGENPNPLRLLTNGSVTASSPPPPAPDVPPTVTTAGYIRGPVYAGHYVAFEAGVWSWGEPFRSIEFCDSNDVCNESVVTWPAPGQSVVVPVTAGHRVRLVERNHGAVFQSPFEAVTPGPDPVLVTPPSVSGVPTVDATLTATRSQWDAPVAVVGRWFSCNTSTSPECEPRTEIDVSSTSFLIQSSDLLTAIPPATYAIQPADAGRRIKYVEYKIGSLGRLTVLIEAPTEIVAESALTDPISYGRSAATVTSPPSFISGNTPPRLGYEISIDPGQWSEPGSNVVTWSRCHGDECSVIEAAIGLAYVPAPVDVGSKLKVTVRRDSDSGSATTADPIESAVVEGAPFTDRGFELVSQSTSGDALSTAVSPSGRFVLYAAVTGEKSSIVETSCAESGGDFTTFMGDHPQPLQAANPVGVAIATGTMRRSDRTGSSDVAVTASGSELFFKTATRVIYTNQFQAVKRAERSVITDQGNGWLGRGLVQFSTGTDERPVSSDRDKYFPVEVAENGTAVSSPLTWCSGGTNDPGCSVFDLNSGDSKVIATGQTGSTCRFAVLSDAGTAGAFKMSTDLAGNGGQTVISTLDPGEDPNDPQSLVNYAPTYVADHSLANVPDGFVIDVTNSARYAVIDTLARPSTGAQDLSAAHQLYRVDTVTGSTALISSGTNFAYSDVSEDGRFVAYTKYDASPVLPPASVGSHVIVKDLQTGATIYHDESRPGDTSESCIAGQFAGYELTFSCKGPRRTSDTDGKWDVYIRPVPFKLPVCAVLGKANWTNTSNDVSAPNANFTRAFDDVSIPSPGPDLTVTRTYNSTDTRVGMFGRGWSSSWDMTAETDSLGNIGVRNSEGACLTFTPKPGGGYTSPQGMFATISKEPNGTIRLKQKDRMEYVFASDTHRLAHIVDGDQNALNLTYDAAGHLSQVTGARGRKLTFLWNGNKVGAVVTDPPTAGGAPLTYTYGYNGDDLIQTCQPAVVATGENTCTSYENTGGRITKVTKPRGNTDVAITYDALGRVRTRTDGMGNTDTYDYGLGAARIIDARGKARTVQFDSQLRVTKEIDPYGNFKSYAYDVHGYRAVIADELGRVTQMLFDERGNMRVSKNPKGESTYYGYRDDDKAWESDARSLNALDVRFQTNYGVDPATGRTLWERSPQATDHGWPTREWVYSQGSEPAYGGGTMPKGLLLIERDQAGKETRYNYDAAGDMRSSTDKNGLLTEYTYDGLGRKVLEKKNATTLSAPLLTWTVWDERSRITKTIEPPVTNHVTNVVHQREVSNIYDQNNNVLGIWERDLGPAPDVPRHSQSTYDANDRVERNITPAGQATQYVYDQVGNRIWVVNPDGTVNRTDYDGNNRPYSQWILNSPVDPYAQPGVTESFEVSNTTYDAAGQAIRTKDAQQSIVENTYDLAGRVTKKVLVSYRDDAGNVTPIELERNTYLANGLLVKKVERGVRTTEFEFDPAGRLMWTLTDPGGAGHADRRIERHYDAVGREIRTTTMEAGRTEEQRVTYDNAGNVRFKTVENGDEDLSTETIYDDRGLPVVTSDALGHWTNTSFDEAGRPWKVEFPEVAAEDVGGVAVAARPTTLSGYNTFGNVVQTVDPVGAATLRTIDLVGRVTDVAGAAVTQADDSVIQPNGHVGYDGMNRPVYQVDTRGGVTDTYYDGRGNMVAQVAPLAVVGQARAVARSEYDRMNRPTATTDPKGLRAEASYDELNRVRTSTQVVPRAGGGEDRYTSRFGYDAFANVIRSEDPLGNVTTSTFDVLGRQRSVTAPSVGGAVPATTSFVPDLAGRTVLTTDPVGRKVRNTYDQAGRQTVGEQIDAAGVILARTESTYDANGNVLTATSPMGFASGADRSHFTTTNTYDPLGRVMSTSKPAAAGVTLTSSVGYDRAGRVTRQTDGNGHSDISTYDALGNMTSLVEPAVAGQPGTFSFLYDAAGSVRSQTDPDGTVQTVARDGVGRVVSMSAAGPLVVSATKSFTYDTAGQMVSVSVGDAAAGGAGSQSLSYDARGLLVSASGPMGNATFGYDALGRMTARDDVSGSSTFGYDSRSRLTSMHDGLSGADKSLTWDDVNQLLRVDMAGANAGAETYAYDTQGRLVQHALVNGSGGVQASFGYGYDADGHVVSQQVVAPGNAGAGSHSYSYDWAGRLTGWQAPGGAAVSYEWDGAGNRTRAGNKTFSYDARDRLVGGSDGTSLVWSPGGNLVSESKGSAVTALSSDGFGRRVGQSVNGSSKAVVFDGLDRVVSSDGSVFAYSGVLLDPSKVGVTVVGRSPGGGVVSEKRGSGQVALVGRDRHGDVSWRFDGSGGLSSATVFDPFGSVVDSSASVVGLSLGFQGDVTDTASGDVWMGARWYSPELASFTSRDSVDAGNRFAYAAGDPLGRWDPDGHASLSVGHVEWQVAGLSELGQSIANAQAAAEADAQNEVVREQNRQQKIADDRAAKRLEDFKERLASCSEENALVDSHSKAFAAECGQAFDQARAVLKGQPEGQDQLATMIFYSYLDRVDKAGGGDGADGKIAPKDLEAVIADKRSPKNLVWAAKRIAASSDLKKQLMRPGESCGAVGWLIDHATGGSCDFSWKKTGVELLATAVAGLVCAGSAGAGCGPAALVVAGVVGGAVGSGGNYLVDVSDGVHDFDASDFLTTTATGAAIGGATGGLLAGGSALLTRALDSGAYPFLNALVAKSTIIKNKVKDLLPSLTRTPATSANPAAEAAGWQGKGAYPGVDDWENVTLAKGTRVHAGEPGVSGFFASDSAAASIGHDAVALNQGLQIAPRNGMFRPGLTEFELTSDVTVGRSIAGANPQFGPGGLEQFYIPDWERVTTPIVSRIMR